MGRRTFPWSGIDFVSEAPTEAVLMHVHQRLVAELLNDLHLPTNPKVLDVGTHNGQFAACLIGMRPDATVVSLEPNPTTFPIAQTNSESMARLGRDWRVLPVGLDSESGTRAFYFVRGRSGQGSLYRENATREMIGNPGADLVSQPLEFVDAKGLRERFCLGSEKWNLIKVDVEGHELMILPQLVELGFDYLLVEVGAARRGKSTVEDVEVELLRAGVQVVHLASYGAIDEVHDALFKVV